MLPLPIAFTERARLQFPLFADDFIRALDGPPVVSVRLNAAKPHVAFPQSQPVLWCPGGFYLDKRPVFTLDPMFHAGCFYPQEASSMFLHHVLSQILPDASGAAVLDLCAAPGGKSTLIASYLAGRGVLVANETIRSRAFILAENLIKWGYPNTLVTQNDPSRFAQVPGMFDVVVVDAPCSGEGMFRKDEVARAEWSPANADLCAARQRRILADVWPTVKEGGFVVYSTCTFNPAENEENLRWMLDGFDAQLQRLPVPQEWGVTEMVVGNGYGYAFYPHAAKGEGFFCAVIQKLSAQPGVKGGRHHSGPSKNAARVSAPSGLLNNDGQFQLVDRNGQVWAIPQAMFDLYQKLSPVCNLLHGGVPLGETMKNDFSPNHALAMSLEYSGCFPAVDLPDQAALNYLRGDTQLGVLPEKGWAVVTCRNVPLGFIKGIGNRINNYYPKEWRIRMR